MAASVVVVTRNATLDVALIHHGYDVVDVRPDAYGDWMAAARTADAVVLELSDAVAAEAAVQRMRTTGMGVPVLLVSNHTAGWDTTAAHVGAAARVLPLPISLPALTAALDELIAAGPVDLPPPPANDGELLAAMAASVGLAIGPEGTLVQDDSGTTARVRVDLPPEAEAAPEQAVAPEAEAAPEQAVAPEAEAAPEQAAPERQAAPEPEPAPAAEPEAADDPAPEPAPAPPAEPAVPAAAVGGDAFAAQVVAWARGRSGLAETAELVLAALAEEVRADAAALLLPYDGRPEPVATLGVAAADVRADAVAGHPYVLSVPVPQVDGVLVAARAHEPFGDDSGAAAATVADGAGPLLAEAVALRAVARALAPYAD